MNPYQEWLGWSEPSEPNYYNLLDLNRGEKDAVKIAAAADRAIAKVRSFRPGEHGKEWAKLLDEIGQAKAVLLDANARARYDEQLPQPVDAVTPSSNVAESNSEKPTMTVKFAEQTPSAFMLPPAVGEPLVKKPESEPEFTPAPSGDSSPPADSSHSADPPVTAPPAADAPIPAADAPIPAAPIPAAPIPAAPTATLTNSYPNSVPDSDTMFEEMLEEVIPVDEPPPAADLPPAANATGLDPAPPSATPEPVTPQPTPAPVASGPPVAKAILASPQAMDPMTPVPVAQPVAAAKSAPEVVKPTVVVAPAQGMNWLVLIGGILIGVVGVAAVAFIVMRGGKQPVVLTNGDKKPDSNGNKESKETSPDQPKAKKASKEEKKGQSKGEKKSADPSGKKSEVKKKAGKKEAKKKQPSNAGKKKKTASKNKKAPDTKKKSVPTKKKKAPDREPTARDVDALAKALMSAKESLGARDWERADKDFAAADKLPKSKKHSVMVDRLKLVSVNARAFWTGVTTTVKQFKGAEEIKVGSTMMIVVDATADALTVKFLGKSRTFKMDKLPKGVAMALSDMALPKDSAKSPVLRGSFLFLQPDLDAQDLKEIRSLWETAELNGVKTTELIKILKDDYEEMSND